MLRGPTRWLFLLCLALGVGYALVFLGVAALRVPYPFELEWMEGGMLTHAARLLDGQQIYAPPSSDFVPFFYTPGYPATVAGLATLTGDLSLPLGRLVSVLSTIACFGFAFRVGQREADWRYGLLAMGIYAALFRTNGAFYDLARPDAFFMMLLCAAVYVAYYKRSWHGATLAGAIFAAGFLTKQTVSVFVPVTALYLLWRDWRHAIVFSVAAFGLAILGVVLIDRATDGWFWTYVFEGHQGHLFYWKNILMEYWRDVLFVAPILLLLPLLWFGYKVPIPTLSVLLAAHWTYAYVFRARTLDYAPHMYFRELFYEDPRWAILIPPALIAGLLLAYRAKNPGIKPRTHTFWLLMYVAGAGASGLNHSTQWAYSNCFMLLSMFAAVLIALACRDLLEPAEGGVRWGAAVPLALLVQFVAWGYNPAAQTPGPEDYEALAEFDAVISTVDGPVFIPAHPLYAWRRDHQVHVHQMGLQDVAFMGGVKDFAERVRAKEWAGVVVDERNRVPGIVGRYYVGHKFEYATPDALRTKTGFLVRPDTLWLAQDPAPRTLEAGVSANFETPTWVGWTAEGDAFAAPSTRRLSGRQGERVAASTVKGQGTLRSAPMELQGRRLTFLLAGKGGPGRVLRLMRGDQELARKNAPNQRRMSLHRVSIPLDQVGDGPVEIEVIDHDPKGSIAIDDLRLVP